MLAFFHPHQLLHHPKTYFSRGKMRTPEEIPERAIELVTAAKSLNCTVTAPNDYGLRPLLAVHDLSYLRFLESAHDRWKAIPEDWGNEVMSNVFVREPNALHGVLAEAARYLADGSCPVGADTWKAAYFSAQSAIAGAEALLRGEHAAYSICRPPGHHSRHNAAGGFCYLNNCAIAAQHLKQNFAKIAIFDTDMHHGQGIQDIFYNRDDVFYVSVHGDPTNFYPVVAGYSNERGEGPGEGYNLNLPMPHGSSESFFFDRVIEGVRAINLFDPDAIVFALGFDVYHEDPQAKVSVTTEGFRRLGEILRSLNRPTLIVQEGGYHISTLGTNLHSFLSGFAP